MKKSAIEEAEKYMSKVKFQELKNKYPMEPLIKIQKSAKGTSIVDARELHSFLIQGAKGGQDGRKFADWIKDKIDYGFIENQDYAILEYNYLGVRLLKNEKSNNQTHKQSKENQVHKREYALTIQMAKELCMLEKNDKGKQARQYFIECERQLKEQPKPKELTRRQLVLMIIEAEDAREIAEAKVLELAPKAEYFDKVLKTDDSFNTTQIAKEMGLTAIKLNKLLFDAGIQFKTNKQWVLTAKYQDLGYTKTRTMILSVDDNEDSKSVHDTVWTEAGRRFIHDKVGISSQKQLAFKK